MSRLASNITKRDHVTLALAAFAVVLLLIPLLFPDLGYPLQLAEWKLQDQTHRTARSPELRPEIVVLGIDDASLSTQSAWPEDVEKSKTLQLMQKGWPWSRAVYAEAIERLLAAGAKVVVLDLMFTGPSGEHPEGDDALRKAVEAHPGKVVLAANFTQAVGINGVVPMLQMPWEGLVPPSDPPPPTVGFVNYWADADQVVRAARYHRSMRNEDAGHPEFAHLDQMWSMPAAALRPVGRAGDAPADDRPRWIRFSDPGAYPPHSLHEIFVPDVWQSNFGSGAVFKDKIVLIGPVAPHMQDFHVTPVGRLAGVQVHAHVIAAALNHSFLRVAPLKLTVLLVLLGALIGRGIASAIKQPLLSFVALIGAVLVGVMMSWFSFDRASVVFNTVAPSLSLLFSGIFVLSYDFALERRQRKQLGDYLTRYFSPDVVALMLRDPDHFRTLQRGATRTITVLFSDLRGFTTMSEKLQPEQVVSQLNEYFSRMVELIHSNSGGIDKFIGDAIMAVWGWVGYENTEQTIQRDALDAVTATLRMREGLSDLNREWLARGQLPLKIGVGVHQGEAVVGDLGSSDRQRGFTVIGDSVNTASRLEGVTKEYGVDNVISEAVWKQVKHKFVCRSTDLVRVKGKTIATPIFTVVHEIEKGKPAGLANFEQAVLEYRAGHFEAALSLLVEAAKLGLDDDLTKVYRERCHALTAEPPATWDGVYVMTKK